MNLFKNFKKVIAWVSICIWISIFIILILSSGCTTFKWEHSPPKDYKWKTDEQHDGGWSGTNNYYVIVKIDKKYNVYNMDRPKKILDK
jgi:hypothetical protein